MEPPQTGSPITSAVPVQDAGMLELNIGWNASGYNDTYDCTADVHAVRTSHSPCSAPLGPDPTTEGVSTKPSTTNHVTHASQPVCCPTAVCTTSSQAASIPGLVPVAHAQPNSDFPNLKPLQVIATPSPTSHPAGPLVRSSAPSEQGPGSTAGSKHQCTVNEDASSQHGESRVAESTCRQDFGDCHVAKRAKTEVHATASAPTDNGAAALPPISGEQMPDNTCSAHIACTVTNSDMLIAPLQPGAIAHNHTSMGVYCTADDPACTASAPPLATHTQDGRLATTTPLADAPSSMLGNMPATCSPSKWVASTGFPVLPTSMQNDTPLTCPPALGAASASTGLPVLPISMQNDTPSTCPPALGAASVALPLSAPSIHHNTPPACTSTDGLVSAALPISPLATQGTTLTACAPADGLVSAALPISPLAMQGNTLTACAPADGLISAALPISPLSMHDNTPTACAPAEDITSMIHLPSPILVQDDTLPLTTLIDKEIPEVRQPPCIHLQDSPLSQSTVTNESSPSKSKPASWSIAGLLSQTLQSAMGRTATLDTRKAPTSTSTSSVDKAAPVDTCNTSQTCTEAPATSSLPSAGALPKPGEQSSSKRSIGRQVLNLSFLSNTTPNRVSHPRKSTPNPAPLPSPTPGIPSKAPLQSPACLPALNLSPTLQSPEAITPSAATAPASLAGATITTPVTPEVDTPARKPRRSPRQHHQRMVTPPSKVSLLQKLTKVGTSMLGPKRSVVPEEEPTPTEPEPPVKRQCRTLSPPARPIFCKECMELIPAQDVRTGVFMTCRGCDSMYHPQCVRVTPQALAAVRHRWTCLLCRTPGKQYTQPSPLPAATPTDLLDEPTPSKLRWRSEEDLNQLRFIPRGPKSRLYWWAEPIDDPPDGSAGTEQGDGGREDVETEEACRRAKGGNRTRRGRRVAAAAQAAAKAAAAMMADGDEEEEVDSAVSRVTPDVSGEQDGAGGSSAGAARDELAPPPRRSRRKAGGIAEAGEVHEGTRSTEGTNGEEWVLAVGAAAADDNNAIFESGESGVQGLDANIASVLAELPDFGDPSAESAVSLMAPPLEDSSWVEFLREQEDNEAHAGMDVFQTQGSNRDLPADNPVTHLDEALPWDVIRPLDASHSTQPSVEDVNIILATKEPGLRLPDMIAGTGDECTSGTVAGVGVNGALQAAAGALCMSMQQTGAYGATRPSGPGVLTGGSLPPSSDSAHTSGAGSRMNARSMGEACDLHADFVIDAFLHSSVKDANGGAVSGIPSSQDVAGSTAELTDDVGNSPAAPEVVIMRDAEEEDNLWCYDGNLQTGTERPRQHALSTGGEEDVANCSGVGMEQAVQSPCTAGTEEGAGKLAESKPELGVLGPAAEVMMPALNDADGAGAPQACNSSNHLLTSSDCDMITAPTLGDCLKAGAPPITRDPQVPMPVKDVLDASSSNYKGFEFNGGTHVLAHDSAGSGQEGINVTTSSVPDESTIKHATPDASAGTSACLRNDTSSFLLADDEKQYHTPVAQVVKALRGEAMACMRPAQDEHSGKMPTHQPALSLSTGIKASSCISEQQDTTPFVTPTATLTAPTSSPNCPPTAYYTPASTLAAPRPSPIHLITACHTPLSTLTEDSLVPPTQAQTAPHSMQLQFNQQSGLVLGGGAGHAAAGLTLQERNPSARQAGGSPSPPATLDSPTEYFTPSPTSSNVSASVYEAPVMKVGGVMAEDAAVSGYQTPVTNADKGIAGSPADSMYQTPVTNADKATAGSPGDSTYQTPVTDADKATAGSPADSMYQTPVTDADYATAGSPADTTYQTPATDADKTMKDSHVIITHRILKIDADKSVTEAPGGDGHEPCMTNADKALADCAETNTQHILITKADEVTLRHGSNEADPDSASLGVCGPDAVDLAPAPGLVKKLSIFTADDLPIDAMNCGPAPVSISTSKSAHTMKAMQDEGEDENNLHDDPGYLGRIGTVTGVVKSPQPLRSPTHVMRSPQRVRSPQGFRAVQGAYVRERDGTCGSGEEVSLGESRLDGAGAVAVRPVLSCHDNLPETPGTPVDRPMGCPYHSLGLGGPGWTGLSR